MRRPTGLVRCATRAKQHVARWIDPAELGAGLLIEVDAATLVAAVIGLAVGGVLGAYRADGGGLGHLVPPHLSEMVRVTASTGVRVVDTRMCTAVAETFQLETGEVVDRRLFGYGGRGPLPLPVSIVIRTKNEERLLGTTLRVIANQLGGWRDGGQVQVVVVDSGSTDNTVAIATSYRADVIRIPPESFTYGRALNIGACYARGDIIVNLSAHSVPLDSLWLANIVLPFTIDPTIAGVVGRQVNWQDATLADRLLTTTKIDASSVPGYVDVRRQDAFSNANGAVRHSVLAQLPFDEAAAAGTDVLWARAVVSRLGLQIFYQPAAAVLHSHYQTLGELARICGRAVSARVQAAQRNRLSDAVPVPS